ncbi:MAG: histidine kinase [Treponema sp.]|nr:histidine kinase [Treponema sp.]
MILSFSLSLVALALIVFSVLLFQLYSVDDDMAERINQYITLNKVSLEIQKSRSNFQKFFEAVQEYEYEDAKKFAKESLVSRHKSILLTRNLKSSYSESPSMYFLNRSIINALVYLNENTQPFEEFAFDMSEEERYKLYYRYLHVFDYLLKYTNYLYLGASVEYDVGALDSNIEKFRKIKFASVILILVIVIFSVIGSISITNGLSSNVKDMVSYAEKISDGDYTSKDMQLSGPREFQLLKNSLNRMKANLIERSAIEQRLHERELEHEKMTKELERAKFLSLQAQINPHFLFNTLNAISNTALFENADKTMKLTHDLAGIFRYRLEFKNSVPLWEEFRFLEQYLEIQKARFSSRLSYKIELDENVRGMEIPPLTIQPFVENAVKHGIEPLEKGGTVAIRAISTCGGGFSVTIEDDGKGLPADFSLSFLDTEEMEHIGIINVVNRLQIFFGGNFSFNMSRISENGGTIVEIKIGETKKGERNGEIQNSDC